MTEDIHNFVSFIYLLLLNYYENDKTADRF